MDGADGWKDPEQYLENAGWMRSLARSLVQDEARAEDIVQDTWVALLTRPPRQARAAGSWIATVLRNFARRGRRADSSRRRRERAAARPEALPATTEMLERAETHRRIVAMVLDLEEPYRSTVFLRFFEEMTPVELSRRQGVPVTTVRSHASKRMEPVVVDQTPVRLDVALEPGASISGRVVDMEEVPVMGAEVIVVPELEMPAPERDRHRSEVLAAIQNNRGGADTWARSAEDGRFELKHIPEGSFIVIARSPGHQPAVSEGIQAGDRLEDLILRPFGSLSGKVTDAAAGLAVPGFKLRMACKVGRLVESFSDPEGRFHVHSLAAGTYGLRLEAEGHAPFFKGVLIESGKEHVLDVRLNPALRVEGVVRAADTSAPIAGASVQLLPARGPAEGTGEPRMMGSRVGSALASPEDEACESWFAPWNDQRTCPGRVNPDETIP